ncbi:hypothetical protein A9Q83_18115 [Alphaproteobacteria bacterium 46_93_T64]|nr:hypothetical protein A9Q83_18115 [Alphaproteobacteria bacterium 46_93_T64]
MLLRQKSILVLITIIALLCSIIGLAFSLGNVSEKLSRAENQRYRAAILADQLRQSSDDLTRMARTYVITENPIYEQYFQHILDIRNGNVERPPNYSGIFWDLVTATDTLPSPDTEKRSLKSLLLELNLSSIEIRLLRQSEAESNDLVDMEITAFNALKGRFKDSAGNFTIIRAPDPKFARNLLHGKSYHYAKLKIMAPIGEFFAELERRTLVTKEKYTEQQRYHIIVLIFLTLTLTIIVVISSSKLISKVLSPIQDLSHISKMNQQGDLQQYKLANNRTDEIGILANSFNEMVNNIKFSISELQKKTQAAEKLEQVAVEANNQVLKMNRELEKRVGERTELLEQSEQRLQAIINNANAIIYVKDLGGRYLLVNKRYEKLFKVKIDDFIGKNDFDLFPKEVAQTFRENDREVLLGGNPIEREEISPIDGEDHIFISVKFPLLNSNGQIYAVCGISTDITDLKNAEKEQRDLETQLRHSQKMEAVGQLTGGIAHDFNNILNIIIGNLEILQEHSVLDEDGQMRATNALKATERAAKLTSKLLGFSRNEEHEKENISVNDAITGLLGLISKSLTASINIETKLEEDVWPVCVNEGELEDAILNLCLNARDATPDGGNLTIETANKTLDKYYIQRNPTGAIGDFVMISISDSGSGMSPEIQEKIFDPFFTTKAAGKGTGLGLSMVYGFVKRSQGHIKIYSETGKGTVIRLYFPRITETTTDTITTNTNDIAIPKGVETILVVDDEEELINVAVTYFETLGYKTLTASNGDQALNILNNSHDIDLMFSDIVMPGNLDGYQLALKAREKYPNLKIVLTSGFTRRHENTLHEGHYEIAELTKHLLVKPYNKRELATCIRNALDAGQKPMKH